ncbi:MAG TPA: hypothetical protein VIY73_07800 [Polyangiaceae bacterium]
MGPENEVRIDSHEPNAPLQDAGLEADIACAEAALHELAVALRRVRLDECTRRLHVRALDLKRAVSGWRSSRPPPEDRREALDEIRQLLEEAAFWDRETQERARPSMV